MAKLPTRTLDINVLDTDEIYKTNNAGTVEARSPVSSVRDPSVTLIAGFVAGPLDPIVDGDSVLKGLEKHEGRVLNHEQTVFETDVYQGVIPNAAPGMFVARDGILIYKGPPKRISAISGKLTVPDSGAVGASFRFKVNGLNVSVLTFITSTDTEENFPLEPGGPHLIEDGDTVDVGSGKGTTGDALTFGGWLSLVDQ